jgi:hypothetical protein
MVIKLLTINYSNLKLPKHFNRFAIFYNWQVMVIIDQLIYRGQVLVLDHEFQYKQASKFMVWQLHKFPYLNPMWVHSQLGFQKGVTHQRMDCKGWFKISQCSTYYNYGVLVCSYYYTSSCKPLDKLVDNKQASSRMSKLHPLSKNCYSSSSLHNERKRK